MSRTWMYVFSIGCAVALQSPTTINLAGAQEPAAGPPAQGPPAQGSVEGQVSFVGTTPATEPIHATIDHHICGREPLANHELMVSPGGLLANAVVVLRGVPTTGTARPRAVELEQQKCRFVPHVQSVTAGSTLTISNDDPTLHNVHAFMNEQTLFNLAMPVKDLRVKRKLKKPGVVSFRCDSGHTWMSAHIVVVGHALHMTTGADGSFSFAGVPPGDYTLWTWHEKLGVLDRAVTVSPGAPTRADVAFSSGTETTAADSTGESAPPASAAGDDRLTDLEDALDATVEETEEALEQLQEAALADRRGRIAREGRALYRRFCATCHGARGDGEGPSAALIDTPPRDFTKGEYKFRMTPSGTPPTEDDLFRTISVGLLGTPMPAWRKTLSATQRRTLARYVMTFSSRFWEVEDEPPTLLVISEEPEMTKESTARGRKLFVDMKCAECHGATGRGDGPAVATLKDDWGSPIEPYDFTIGYYKGGRGAAVVYRALSTGLSGTPMPSYADVIGPTQRWDLVHYIRSLGRKRGTADYLLRDPAGRISSP